MKKDIGNRIKEYRTQIKMSQVELALKVGVTNRAVSNWESGKNGVDVDLIPAICSALEISPNDLLNTPDARVFSAETTIFAIAFDSLDVPGKAAVQAVLETQQHRIREYGPATKP